MFGGRWEEEEQFAFFSRPYETGMRVYLSSDRDEALFGAQTNGMELRIQREPAGDPEPDPPPSEAMSADDLFLRSFGQWRCGDKTIFVGVRRIVFATRETDAVCRGVSVESAGDARIRVKCRAVTGDHEDVLSPGTPARYTERGFLLEVQPTAMRLDGTGCRRFAGKRR
jgi:hypothetical protein